MHILIVPSERMMTWDSPVGAVFQLDQAKALSKLGNKVAIISPAPTTLLAKLRGILELNFSAKVVPDEIIENVRILRTTKQIFYPARFSEKKYVTSFVKEGLRLWQNYIAMMGEPDVVHVHNGWCAGLLAIELKKNGYRGKIVLTEHDSSTGVVPFSSYRKRQLQQAYSACDNVLAVSSYLKNRMVEYFGLGNKQITIVANCIDVNILNIEQKTVQKRNELKTITTVGSLIPRKAHQLLIEAFSIALSKNDNLRLNIIGKGPLEDSLIHLINKLKCGDYIQLMGHKDRRDIGLVFMKSDMFVLPSQRETFGVVLIEALSFGLPCIAFKGSGPDDIITPENGILVENQNPESLAMAILEMIDNLGRYDSERIKQDTLHRFSDVGVGEQLQDIYQSIPLKF